MTETASAHDVPTLLAGLAALGDRPALTFYRGKARAGRQSYADLGVEVSALAAALAHGLGVQGGDRVAILAPNRLPIPAVVLALLSIGAVIVPLNPLSAPEDWAYILGHAGARGLVGTRDLLARVTDYAGFRLDVEDLPRSHAGAPPAGRSRADDLAAILYTSGTTGAPKGVALRQRNLLANARSMASNFHLSGTTQLAVLPLYHAHAFGFGLMTALSTGGHLVFTERLEPFTWAEVIRQESVEVSSVVPSLLPMLLAAGVTRERTPTLRHLMVSSAPLPTDVARDFEARTKIRLVQGWGLSEFTNFACCMSPDASPEAHARLLFDREVPSIGPALPGNEVRVVTADGARAGEGARGELLVRGPSTMAGYFADAEATARAIDDEGWLHSGDEGMFHLHEGSPVFFVTGRLKEIIIRDAEKFSPLALERRLIAALPELSGRLVVVGFPHEEHGEEVGAYLEAEAVDDALRARLLEAIARLPLPERPKVILHGARPAPRTHTGKIQRRRMQPWFAAWSTHRGAVVLAARPADAVTS